MLNHLKCFTALEISGPSAHIKFPNIFYFISVSSSSTKVSTLYDKVQLSNSGLVGNTEDVGSSPGTGRYIVLSEDHLERWSSGIGSCPQWQAKEPQGQMVIPDPLSFS